MLASLNFNVLLHSESDFVSIVGLDVTFSTDESEKRIVVQTNSDVMVEATERFSAIITSTSDRVVVLVDKADINILETSIGMQDCMMMAL